MPPPPPPAAPRLLRDHTYFSLSYLRLFAGFYGSPDSIIDMRPILGKDEVTGGLVIGTNFKPKLSSFFPQPYRHHSDGPFDRARSILDM